MLTNKTFNILPILLVFLFSSLISSCVEDPIYLNSKQLKLVDTLAKHQVIPLRGELDSLCDLRFNAEVEKAKDSIIILRIQEINKKLGR